MKAHKYIFFGILVLMLLGHVPTLQSYTQDHISSSQMSPSSHPASLYKFNAMTDTASNLQLSSVYSLSKGKGMLIAEIDTGVSTMYESHIFHNNKESLDGHDDDHNGYIDDVRGWNVLDDNNNTYDNSITYHGTEVASMILNIAPDATILPIKFINSNNQITDLTQLLKLNDALDYAALWHPDIIVMAFNFNIVTPSSILTRLQNLQNNGTIILVSAGNCDGTVSNCDYVQSPARNSYVYAIGSVDSNLHHSDFASYGPTLDYSLFGQDVTVYSPDYPSGTLENGTSFSVAQAGGLFALYKAMYLEKYNTFNLTDFMESIAITAHELGTSTLYGRGLPQIYTAYKALYDTDYPQLLGYTFSQAGTQLVVNLKVDDQSGIGNCTYTINNQDYGMNQTCSSPGLLLPIVSNSNNIAQYSFYLSNISDLMQVKLYLTDLHFHTDRYILQISISLTSQDSITNPMNSSSYVVRNNNQSSTQVDQESTIGVYSVTNSTKPKTAPFLEINVLFLALSALILIKKFRRKNDE